MHIEPSVRLLPASVVDCKASLALGDEELRGLLGKMNFISELSEKIAQWAHGGWDDESISAILDNIELDLGVALSLRSEPPNTYSWWTTHSTWSFLAQPSEFLSSLPSGVIPFLNSPFPDVDCEIRAFRAWLGRSNNTLISLIEFFFNSIRFGEALASIVAINVLLSSMLSVVSRQRLNKNFLQQ